MEIDVSTPAALFPAISLLLLAYTNRFMGVTQIGDTQIGDRLNLPQFNGYFKSATMSLEEYPNETQKTL